MNEMYGIEIDDEIFYFLNGSFPVRKIDSIVLKTTKNYITKYDPKHNVSVKTLDNYTEEINIKIGTLDINVNRKIVEKEKTHEEVRKIIKEFSNFIWRKKKTKRKI